MIEGVYIAVLPKRVQFVLRESVWQNLVQAAQVQNCLVCALIREVVAQVYFSEPLQAQTKEHTQIMDKIAGMNLPVDDGTNRT
jgi:hypothetical protein